MRENVNKAGLIIALIIASVSLPIGITGFMKEGTINNYYTENYYNDYYNNQTFYDIVNYYNYTSTPEEKIEYPLVRYDFVSNSSTLGVNKTHIYNAGQDAFLQLVMISNSTNEAQVIINMYSLEWYNRGILIEGANERTLSGKFTYPIITFPYNNTWILTFEMKDAFDNGVHINMTLWHQVYYY